MEHSICKSLFQTTLEKQNRALHGDIGDKTQRLDDLHTSLAEADITKKKLSVEKGDLEKQIDEADKTLRALGKIKSSLSTQVCKIVTVLSTGCLISYSLFFFQMGRSARKDDFLMIFDVEKIWTFGFITID